MGGSSPTSSPERRLGLALLLLAVATAAGAQRFEIAHQGLARSYVAQLPPQQAAGRPLPLLIALHGTSMRAEDMFAYTDLVPLAEREGLLLVAPASVGPVFNDGFGAAGTEAAQVDDVGFIEAVADDARARFGARADAVYVVGLSNGGSMVQRLAIESRYPFAGFAAVASAPRVATPGVARPAPLLLVFGRADPLNSPAGGWVWTPVPHAKPPVDATVRQWAQRLQCEGAPQQDLPQPGVQRLQWPQCAGGSRLAVLQLEGQGHHWAGARRLPFPSFVVGPQRTSPPLGELVWDFLADASRTNVSRTSSALPAATSAAVPPAAPPGPGPAPPPAPAAAR